MNAWLTCRKPNPQTRLRLFCFPYAGGGASIFRLWTDSLLPEIEVCSVQLPGRENRLAHLPFHTLGPLLETLAPILQPYLDRPFAFFGHSMGALISFELTRRLRTDYGLGPVCLFVSAYRAPQLPQRTPLLHCLPDPALVADLCQLNGTAPDVLHHAEFMAVLLPVLRADFALCETYHYTRDEPLAAPLSAFGGWHDSQVSQDELMAWRAQTCSAFTLRMFPGNHFFLREARVELVRAIYEDIQRFLA